jgi:hypothetical protein
VEKGFRSARPSCGTAVGVGADSELDIVFRQSRLVLTFLSAARASNTALDCDLNGSES